ncbi:hypothetical protein [Lishizhenia sp.]|uniref:hypothetical protein n=1 Tax=Lishizhenia sp. TaxID=2497594 RepID=UPI00299ED8D5|nr:hypothetical protein [Lishizhenia sp.]MDX1445214.1 hypothetical protein [Lishizhenia sp.]
MRSKTNHLSFFSVLPLYLVLFIFSACSSTQNVGKSLQSQEKTRELAIEHHIKSTLGADSSHYESIAYGKLIVTKPESFFPLDSMYRLKTELLKNKGKNYYKLEELEEAIAVKRLELEAEKSNIIYEQEHVYAIKKDSTVEIHEVVVNLKDQIKVNYITPLEKSEFSKQLFYTYKLYFFNLPFVITNYYYASQEEIEFYRLYKGKYESLFDEAERNTFLEHTLQVMRKAKRINSLSVKKLVEKDLRDQLDRKFTIINFEVEETAEGETIAYYCVIEFSDDQEPQFHEYRYDVYLRQTDF